MSTSGQVRAVIELFCLFLRENCVSDARAESLRQAKFNKDSAASKLWTILFDTICFCNFCQPLLVTPTKEDVVVYVKTELQKWGYLSQSLAMLPSDMSSGSRELLLALGWVVHTQKLFDKVITRRSNPLEQQLLEFVPSDGKQTNLDTCPPDLCKQSSILPAERTQQQLVLCGKLQMALRRLYSVDQQLAGLRNTIHQCTQGVCLQSDLNHLTSLEVYLLRHPESLKQMLNELEKDNVEMKHLLEWKELEHFFWEWMDSVLHLHIQEKDDPVKPASDPASDPAKLGGVIQSECVYLPVPKTLGRDITETRSKLREFILTHEADIDRLDQLILDKKVSRVEVDVLTRQIDGELASLATRLDQCGRGRLMDQEHPSDNSFVCQRELPISLPVIDGRQRTRSKFVAHSDKGVKASKQASLNEAVQVEILAMGEKVRRLEEDLKQLQIRNMHKLQEILDGDPSVICIQPRCFKKLLGS
ncbi:unnamed protein product [Lymnaea stagnalis]|uniref:Tubulin epsilon and delta complex protein 1 domain-containing protein n=1 Tax=Lymnaea stagnalis TaxID=6523 RepID=A0AAV2H9U5_LYMST